MADSPKKAKYFCEGCGSEVPANAKFCKHCGRFFAAVRCPQCGKTGTVSDFKSGCPRCHYAMSDAEIWGEEAPEEDTLDGTKHSLSKQSKKKIKEAFRKHESYMSDAVPMWLLIPSLVLLAVVCVLFFIRCSPISL